MTMPRLCFDNHDALELIACDNGFHFVNEMCKESMDKKNIKYIHMWPYNPSSNVLSEKVIQVFKNGMKEFS